ncbi:MAG: hypothetical protein JWM05_2396 [Acidimicrobiales bacterium]|nr:hypothetical protein [Acidimicrobiales bacterium]
MIASNGAPARGSVSLRSVVALLAALLWLGGLGSLVAIALAAPAVRRGAACAAAPADGTLLRVAFWLGVAGLAVSIVFGGLLVSAR